jgi:hypothetical protein
MAKSSCAEGSGRTLYLDTADNPRNTSSCAANRLSCPQIWPALKPPASAGAAFADGLARGEEVASGPVSEPVHAHHRQHLVGCAQLLAGVDAPVFAS